MNKSEQNNLTAPNTNDGHDYVDLGLSVKWATCNIGATKPEEYGDYFAWGEITPKETYNWHWSNYKYSSDPNTLTKYCNSSDYGIVDNKTTLEPADDAATANWGGSWHIPTFDEWKELVDNCTLEKTEQNGVNGYKITSNKNGNSLFLPAAGYRYDDKQKDAGSYAYYWLNSLDKDSPFAQIMNFSPHKPSAGDFRYMGHSVRPVCK